MLLPAAFPCDILELFIQQLDRAKVLCKVTVKPDVFDDRLLLIGQAGECVLFAGLAAEGQRFEIVAVLTVFLLKLECPGGSLREVLLVTV